MVDVIPFRGILYNPERIKNLSDVTTPPYDVISEKQQEGFYNRHPYNIIRLDKNRPEKQDTQTNNPPIRAAACFAEWLKEGVLIRDPLPAMYLTSVDFQLHGKPITRYGLIARIRLEPFERGVILPHEQTFSKVKSERLELIKTCHANFSQVFSIFSDRAKVIDSLKAAFAQTAPVFDFTGDDGLHHRLWRITDPALHQMVSDGLKDKRLFIADGHHRYETALTYREWRREQDPGIDSMHPANYIMMYLCSMEDPGLIILPTHRLVSDVPKASQNQFIQKAQAYFDIVSFPFRPHDPGSAQHILKTRMRPGSVEHQFGVFIKNSPEFYILRLKPKMMDNLSDNHIKPPLKKLDVTVLTRLIFFQILGFDDAALDNEKRIQFRSHEHEAIASIAAGEFDMAFILNPTTNEQVREVAANGLTMPRKSTYYYPKALTGLVINDLTETPSGHPRR